MFPGIFVLVVAAFALSLLLAGVVYQRHGLKRDRQRHLPPGHLISLGDRRLHIYQTGSGQPTVIFESGLASSSLSWMPVQQAVGLRTRALSYDRAGIGWSDEPHDERSVSSMVADLERLLRASGNLPPYVLVGHSFGGLLALSYASLKKEEVAGLVLVDPVSLDVWADCSAENERRLRLGAKLSRRGVLLANIGIVRLALTALSSGKTRLPKAVAKASAGKALGTMSRLTGVVQKLPASLRPSVQSHWSQAKSFRALAEYLEVLPKCAREAQTLSVPPELPVTVLSAASATPEEFAERERWANASMRGRHLQIPDSGHWIHLEHPEQVAEAILDLVEYVRSKQTDAH